ncbi:PD-(D/E)XK nuclease family protein [Yersinia enterocolitica]|uniref:PD-(D/E)XK nuclease family protein n=1 Tax=Yersinia enterocolitica TaxID=630 RepID=UPI0009B25C21|nr:PD-(D/E)XK nuclease family protein [Yersinia enterocolitica]
MIIENKIHGAADQKEQLKRYINITKHLGFSANNIYVLYLTGIDSECELSNSLAEYSESFMGRIQVSSFSTDILAWLENDVIPNVRNKDRNLLFFVSQYIDHLKGLYFKRDKDKNMNAQLTEYLIESMGLKNESLERTISVIEKELNVVNGLQKRLAGLIIEKKEKVFDYWFETLKMDFPHLSVLRNADDSTLTKVGVIFYSDKGCFSVLIEKNNDSLYFGIGRHFTKDAILDEKIKSFSDVFLDKEFKVSPWWYGWKFTNYETGYHELSVLIRKIQAVL